MWKTARRLLTVLACSALAGTLLTAPVASAALTALPLPGFGDVAVDQVRNQIFVSGGPSSNSVVVTDGLGQPKKTIDNLPGAAGLVVSADQNQLYVALSAGDAIAVIDTVNLTETKRIQLGPQTCPTHLHRVSTVYWFGYGCAGTFTGRIGVYNSANQLYLLDLQGRPPYQGPPLLTSAITPAGKLLLVAGQTDLSQSRLQVYDTVGATLVPIASGDVVGSNLTDLDMTADGSAFYSAAGSRDRVDAFAPSDLSRSGAYSARPRPNAIALHPQGGFVAIGANTGDDKDALVYKLGASVPTKTIGLLAGDRVAPRGLAWMLNLNRLIVVSQHDNQPQPSLNVYPLATTA